VGGMEVNVLIKFYGILVLPLVSENTVTVSIQKIQLLDQSCTANTHLNTKLQ
jgi:hypothetical protein